MTIIKAEFLPELIPKASGIYMPCCRLSNGVKVYIDILGAWYIDLSDRATFLLALDVLMARKKGDSFELDADGGWIVWCGAYKYGDSLFAFNAQDPIHALKLALEATK